MLGFSEAVEAFHAFLSSLFRRRSRKLPLERPDPAGIRRSPFGRHVRISGHDFSNRSYDSFHVRVVPRLSGPSGCRIIPHRSYRRGDGTIVRGRIERCNFIAIPH